MFSFRVQNREALESVEGGLVIASNHVSFLDPPLIGSAYRDPIYYFARKTLFDHPIANFILTRVNALPVNQEKPELSVLKRVISLLKKDEKVLIFPEGERSYDGVLKEKGQTGVGMIVTKSTKPVLPVRLFGAEKALPRGGKHMKRHPITLVVGEPIDFTEVIEDSS
ncbi:MAG: lysophospholipid acyltransferase family protein, partial [Verrucomicrobiota bacterium]